MVLVGWRAPSGLRCQGCSFKYTRGELLRRQQFVPVFRDGARTGEVGLDHLDEPWLVRCDAMSAEEPLEIREHEGALARQFCNAAVDCVQSPSKLDRCQPRQPEL